MASTVLSILNRLEAVSGRLEKEAILKSNCSNELLKRAFELALDPTINFYIKQVPNACPPLTIGQLTLKMRSRSFRSFRLAE